MKTITRAAALVLAYALASGTADAGEVRIKLATLVPEGSIWDKEERLFGDECRRLTDGRVTFQFYAGGVAGDEPDVLRKIRLRQLQGGSFTLSNLGDVVPDLRLFDVPLLFRTDEEVLHVLRETEDHYRNELEQKGLVLLHWGHAGWLRFFSTEPVRTVKDLKGLKQFVWAGQGNMARWYQEAGFQPVPLAATDMLTGLETGLIEALPSTPLAALALQWFRSAPNMLDERVAPLLGAVVVDARTWRSISEADREAVLAAGRRLEDELFEEIPKREREAIEAMRARGLTVTQPDEGQHDEWRALAEHFSSRMSGHLIDPAVLRRAREELASFREAADRQNGG